MTGPSVQTLTVPATAGSLGPATDFLRQAAQQAQLPEARSGHVELILEEILMNLSLYAYPPGTSGAVVIAYGIPKPGKLWVEISDQGREFDPLAGDVPDLSLDLAGRPVGGLGLFLIRSFADSLSYQRDQGWNRLRFAVSAT